MKRRGKRKKVLLKMMKTFRNRNEALEIINRIAIVWVIYGRELTIKINDDEGVIKVTYDMKP